jgi:origin recognition complex subunit 1
VWEDISHENENDMMGLLDRLETETQSKSMKKRKFEKRKKGDEDFTGGNLDEEELEAETPRKKQKLAGVSTPRKPRTPLKLVTPSHKRYFSIKSLSSDMLTSYQSCRQETS